MEYLYSPWRKAYFGGKSDECVFCGISKNPQLDLQNRVFYRDEICFCVMNKFPYTPAHFLLVPHTHICSPSGLEPSLWAHLGEISQNCVNILEEYLELKEPPNQQKRGINVGLNLYKAAGAGIPEHLHIHFVPRFFGDTNFITTIGNARNYGVDFDEIFEKIKEISKKHLG